MFDWPRLFLLFASSCLLTILFIPGVRRLAIRWGCVSLPSAERWHQRPTPYLGGVAFFVSFMLSALFFSSASGAVLPLLLVAFLAFLLGLYDDLCRINPATKLVGQIITAAAALFFGYSLHFFTWPLLDALLTALWIIGLTNAMNLLDNMDGLAGGIGLIAALYLASLFYQHEDPQHTIVALSLAGAVAGFLLFNFYPASLFMGDAGSLFLGSALSLLAVHTHGQASNILSLVAVPALILFVPILDTTLVSVTRLRRGQAVSQGGKDHSSHRLVILGLSEPKAVLLLYGMATLSGATAVLIERVAYTLSLALVPFVVLSFALFTAYLAQLELVSNEEGRRKIPAGRLPVLLLSFTYKRRLLEVALDFFLITLSYYFAFILRFDFRPDANDMALCVASLPVVVTSTYSAFFIFGIYRGVWRYTGLEDLVRFAKGVGAGTLIAVLTFLLFYRFAGYSRVVFILYPLFLFFGMAGSRLSFRFFDMFINRLQSERVPVLIYGAGDGGELVARECRKNPKLGYQPIGFLDDDPQKQGRVVCGLQVFGGVETLAEVLERQKVQGLIISSPHIWANGNAEKARVLCRERDVWIRRLRLEFVEE